VISKDHPNRKAHNWLVYEINDRFLLNAQERFYGDIYDLGCGDAPYKDFFLSRGTTYTGVDWSNSQHDVNPDIVADLNEPLPIDSGVADCVVCLSVIEHLISPQTLLDESHRILKRDGSLVLQVPWQWWIHEAPYDFFRFTPYALHSLLEKSGFSDISVQPQSGFFTTWLLKFNYFLRRLVRGPVALRAIIIAALYPVWFVNQLIAPMLDRFDRHWAAEAMGYFVTARKL
jgi:SAM-dependent methyltransferase